jgi:predicted DsbA family dithiol-disulfide isomerase
MQDDGRRVVEVFADVWCPFTHVGLRRWAERRAEAHRRDVVLRVRAWPLELVNGEPLSPEVVGHEIADLRAQVAPGLFGGFDPSRFPATTLPAHRLTHHAYALSDVIGESVALELRDRLFEHGEDVSDPAVLAAVARNNGFDPPRDLVEVAHGADPVQADLAEGRARGVVGSPHFFAPGLDVFCPTLRIRKEGEHFHIEQAFAQLDRLWEASFA